jgi:anti-anti-sigma factor
MADSDLTTAVRLEESLPVIDLAGEVNSSAEGRLDAAFANVCSSAPSAVLLNFRDVSYINSTGIALIVALLARARRAKIKLLVAGLSEHYQHIFSITRLADFMTICDDEAAAVAVASDVQEHRPGGGS